MAWKKSPPELVALIAEAMAPFACQKRVMFGYPAYFVNDNMFACLHEDRVVVRLADGDREELLTGNMGAKAFEPMPGRAMREYVVVPETIYRDQAVLDEWLDRSYRFALALPPKERKKRG